MLPKDVNSSRRTRVAQNSSIVSIHKRKNSSTQTANFGFMESGSQFSINDGKISKNDQNIYKKALDFVNKWNIAMNDYLKKSKKEECFKFDENFNIAPLPNYMMLFVTALELDSRLSDTRKPSKKNSYTQTRNSVDKSVMDVKSQTQYVRFADEAIENRKDIENVPRHGPQAQYRSYTKCKNDQKSFSPQNSNRCPPLKQSARFSESNIRQTSSSVAQHDYMSAGHITPVRASVRGQDRLGSAANPPVRQNQSAANLSVLGRRKRPLSGFLSPNGMIASEINANGTPIVVRDMFERAQNPLGVFVSRGNILKNISRSGSSSSSVILSDKESGEVKTDGDEVERTSSPYEEDLRGFDSLRASSDCEEEDSSHKHHPLNLNERDLNSKDKNFISSIGIFTEAGELKPNAKNYLETKEDVKKGTFRAPRLSQLHMTEHYNVKSCTSESLLSDILSTKSSEYDE